MAGNFFTDTKIQKRIMISNILHFLQQLVLPKLPPLKDSVNFDFTPIVNEGWSIYDKQMKWYFTGKIINTTMLFSVTSDRAALYATHEDAETAINFYLRHNAFIGWKEDLKIIYVINEPGINPVNENI